jgi:hypothetical protein
MAEIIPFADLVRARRRERDRETARQCLQLIELNLRLAVDQFGVARSSDRAIWARRIRVLGELLDYALHLP